MHIFLKKTVINLMFLSHFKYMTLQKTALSKLIVKILRLLSSFCLAHFEESEIELRL